MADRSDNSAGGPTQASELAVRESPFPDEGIHRSEATSVRLLPGQQLLTTGWDGYWRTWNRENGQLLQEHRAGFEEVDLLAVAPGESLAVFGVQRRLEVIDLATGSALEGFAPRSTSSPTHAAAFHPDGDLLLTGTQDKKIHVWDLSSGTRIETLDGHRRAVSAIGFFGAGPLVASSAMDGEVRTWNLSEGRCRSHRWLMRSPITAMCLLDDDSAFAVGNSQGDICIWNAGAYKERAQFSAHVGSIHDICALGSQHICTVAGDGELRVWRARDEELVAWHDAGVALHACAWDGRTIYVTGDDGRLTELAWPNEDV